MSMHVIFNGRCLNCGGKGGTPGPCKGTGSSQAAAHGILGAKARAAGISPGGAKPKSSGGKPKGAPVGDDKKAGGVFDKIIREMELDNGGSFPVTPAQRKAAVPHVQALMKKGYFKNDDDVSQIAAGEHSEMHARFKKGGASFKKLNKIIEKIFDGGDD
jgi:hypothetical protein